MNNQKTHNDIVYLKQYSSVTESKLGKDISSYLQDERMIIAMIVATNLYKTAADGVSPFLMNKFREQFIEVEKNPDLYGYNSLFLKRSMGHMIKRIMLSQGYEVDKSPVKLPEGRNILFNFGTRYKKVL